MSIKWNVADTGNYPEIGQKIWLLHWYDDSYDTAYKRSATYLGNDQYQILYWDEPVTIFYALWIPYE